MNRFLSPMACAAAMLAIVSCNNTAKQTAQTETGQPQGMEIFFADPTVYTENGKYYLTGTRNAEPLGFTMLESTDLKTWTLARPDSMILAKGKNAYGDKGF